MPNRWLILLCFAISVTNSEIYSNRTKRWTNDISCGYLTREHLNSGTWPFIASVYVARNGVLSFICNGVLITNKAILTSAHCVQSKSGVSSHISQNLRVQLGNSNHHYRADINLYHISSIELHTNWNAVSGYFSIDIAIVFLAQTVYFNKAISPICLFDYAAKVENINQGWLIGWGQRINAQRREVTALKASYAQILDLTSCFQNDPNIGAYLSATTFCAKSNDPFGCLDYSGSGLFVLHNNRYHLAGLISVSSTVTSAGYCSNFAVVTNVHLVINWIENHIASGGNLPAIPALASPARDPIQIQRPSVTADPVPSNSQCGIMTQSTGLIQGGRTALEGQWPWAVAVYRKQSFTGFILNFITGSLISNRHVYTEALALSILNNVNRIEFPRPSEIRLYIGRNSLEGITPSTSYANAKKFIIHPSYRFGIPSQSNIAIIVLEKAVKFSSNIFPVCLWDSTSDISDLIGKKGFAFGYGGHSKESPTMIKKHTSMTIQSQRSCPRDYKYLLNNLRDSSNFFCAGATRGDDTASTLCLGDAYSLYYKMHGLWYLLAIGAYHDLVLQTSSCGTKKPVMFEHVGSYVGWMRKIIDNN